MTREEATHKLDFMKKAYQKLIDEKVDNGKFVGKDITGVWKADTTLDEVYKSMIEALDIAIKALEQQPCEDCISREAVMKCFEKWQPYMATRLWDYELALKDLPSVTPHPIIGQWLEVIDDTDSSGRKKNWHYKCSICGNEDSCLGEYNYCPICGAEMKDV